MDYQEAWDELKDRLNKAAIELLKLESTYLSDLNNEEYLRIHSKLDGLKIAFEYRGNLQDCID
jgi:hypothetical protein